MRDNKYDILHHQLTVHLVTIASRTCIIVADSILVLITWLSLFQKNAKFPFTLGTVTLVEVLLRDGKWIVS